MAQTKKKPGRPPGSKNKTKKQNTTATTKAEIKAMQERRKADERVIDEIWGVIFIALGIFLFAAVQFQAAGELGNNIGEVLKGVFGLVGVIFPWYLVVFGILMFSNKTIHISMYTVSLCMLILLSLCLINSGRFIDEAKLTYDFAAFYQEGITLENGGFLGMTIGTALVKGIGMVGLYIFSLVAIIVSLLLMINTPVSRAIEAIQNKREERQILREQAKEDRVAELKKENAELQRQMKQQNLPEPKPTKEEPKQISMFRREGKDIKIINPYDESPVGFEKSSENIMKYMRDDQLFDKTKQTQPAGNFGLDGKVNYGGGYGLDGTPAKTEPAKTSEQPAVKSYGMEPAASEMPSGVVQMEEPVVPKLSKKEAGSLTLDPEEIAGTKPVLKYKKPPITLLNKPKADGNRNLNQDLRKKADKLEETLRNFKVDARVVQVTQGPAVTRYEIQPNVGVKVSKIVNLADDIALNLEAKSIRIEAPIPGKAAVGIEIENDNVNMVTLREILDSDAFKKAKSKITFAVGKDIAGNAIVADLKSMPHLLIAGSTGSGKSVCINSIITSVLYKADPDEVKLVLIDPKVVELGNYNGIPHLLIPVVTEPTKAAAALNWAVAEMTDRYKKFAEAQVRDLESYNDTMRIQGEEDQILPQIVIIIDELADLMMAAPSQVEESICRLAQMARAAGMHLIVATQRPSVDIITGVIKANIPSRIAFAVSSQFDSRTILDMAGAEKLVGKGDMLFNPLGMGKPVRVQGTFVSDGEVHSVIEHVKGQVEEVAYSGDVLHTIEKGNLPEGKDDDGDELLAEAIACVVAAGQASVSMLQRRFRIGYNRAARMVDMMEARGIVGPQDGSRPRQVLMTEEELAAMRNEVENE